MNRKAYRVYNKRTIKVEESIKVIFDESNNSFDKEGEIEPSASKDQNEGKSSREKETPTVSTKDTIAYNKEAVKELEVELESNNDHTSKFKCNLSHPKS